MRAYVIDEISSGDMEKIRAYLKEKTRPSGLGDLYWIPVPEDLLREIQAAHHECGPHVFALETGRGWIRLEFFVRASNNMRCECAAVTTGAQRDYLISFADRMLAHLQIRS